MNVIRNNISIILIALFVLIIILFTWQLDVLNWKKLDLDKLTSFEFKSVILDSDNEAVLTLGGNISGGYAALSELPDYVPNAFIAAEDARFYSHGGIDIKRIIAAVAANLRSGSYSQGASTITQQLIKLTHLTSEKTLSRKVQEAWLAMQLERSWTKGQILEAYINTVYFGGGAYGIDAAAMRYFSKDAASLSLSEAAMLAGIIKSPSGFAPHNDLEAAVIRRDYVIGSMQKCGFIDAATAAEASSEPVILNETLASDGYSWYSDQVCMEACEILGISLDKLISGGYSIYSCMDPEMQNAAEVIMANEELYPEAAAQGAMAVIHPESGAVCAMVGGRAYNAQLELNRVYSKRQPGSLIKPVSTYAAAIEDHGFLPTSIVFDTQREYSRGYTPGNSGGNYYGAVTMRLALAKSLNAATVDLADTLGISEIKETLEDFHIYPDESDNDLALSLGAMTYGVSPLEMCAAYASLANQGVYNEPYLIRTIANKYGKTIYSHQQGPERAISEESAYILTDMLKTAAGSGTARQLSQSGMPVAGKTGTAGLSNGDTSDAWAAAYTPDISVTVWIGKDSNSEGGMAASVSGAGYAVPACTEFLISINDRLSGRDFAMPESLCRFAIDSYALEQHSEVLLAAENTPAEHTVFELFRKDTALQQSDIWNTPVPVEDLALISDPGDPPVLQFTGADYYAEYLIIRKCQGISELVCILDCNPDKKIVYKDNDCDVSQINIYTVIPRHKLLYESGTVCSGTESAPVVYMPDGLLNRIASTAEEDTDIPDIETLPDPLF